MDSGDGTLGSQFLARGSGPRVKMTLLELRVLESSLTWTLSKLETIAVLVILSHCCASNRKKCVFVFGTVDEMIFILN